MAEHTELDEGLWLSVTELAELKRVRKSTISERVKGLVERGLLTVKAGEGKKKLINLAQYDTAVGQVGDVAREQGAATKADLAGRTAAKEATAEANSRFRDEATRAKAYDADLKQIELEKARGNLLQVAEFDPLADQAASRIGDVLDSLMARDLDLTAIAVREGENGMRAALKRIVRGQREAIVKAMKDLARDARARANADAAAMVIETELPFDDAAELPLQ